MGSVFRRLPGFRTGKRWKQIVAIVVLSLNPGKFRSRLPLLGSDQRLQATAGYVLLGAI